MPPLKPTDRWIYEKIATHKLALTKKLGFAQEESRQRRKDVVRYLDEVLMDVYLATTFLVGRLLPGLSQDSVAWNNCAMPTGAEFKKLIGVKFPLSDCHMDRLTSEVLPLVQSDHKRLSRAVREPLEALDWPLEVLVIIQKILGLKIWPAIPTSWRRLKEFIYTDDVLTACFHKQAKRYFPKDQLRCWELVSVIRDETYLTAVSSAEDRATKVRPDLRAEMLGMPLFSLAVRRARDHAIQPPMQQVHDQQISPQVPTVTGNTSDIELKDWLETNLSKLPLLNRRVIRLRFAGYNDVEIADILVQFGKQLASLVDELETLRTDLASLLANELDDDEGAIIESSIQDFEKLISDARRESDDLLQINAAKVRNLRLESAKWLEIQPEEE